MVELIIVVGIVGFCGGLNGRNAMGMFDYLRCEYPLPRGANALGFQTKDTPAQFLDTYTITKDGRLLHEEYDFEDRSDKNAPPGSLESIIGLMTRVNQRIEFCEYFTGEIRFYDGGDYGKESEWWVEFSAYFVAGALKHLEPIQDTRHD